VWNVNPEEILAARRRLLGPGLSLHYRHPLHIVRGSMQYLYDADGTEYLDGVNNVAHVGHEHPRVVEALRRQAGILNTNTRYLHEGVVDYAKRLLATFPEPFTRCWFVNSGSEANDLALRIARAHTRRRDVMVLEGAYHGHTTAMIELSPYKYRGPGGEGPPAHVHEVPLPDPYRGLHRGSDAGPAYASEVERVLEEARALGHPIGAFFVEALPGCGGQIVPPAGFLAPALEAARASGAVTVADEVQTGFGRSGSRFWAFQVVGAGKGPGALPDIVTLGKPMGNGHPVAAVVATEEVGASFDTGMEYFNTFGGNPVSMAVAGAVLDVIEEEGLQAHAARVGDQLLEALRALMERHPVIGDVRGRGLYLGMELVLDREARTPAPKLASLVAEEMRNRRILLGTDGIQGNVLKVKPPLAFQDADGERLVSALDEVLGGLEPSGPDQRSLENDTSL
jgi:4-aminobutyrate aminotransferase-like enzyme